jgi:hypothetical protein
MIPSAGPGEAVLPSPRLNRTWMAGTSTGRARLFRPGVWSQGYTGKISCSLWQAPDQIRGRGALEKTASASLSVMELITRLACSINWAVVIPEDGVGIYSRGFALRQRHENRRPAEGGERRKRVHTMHEEEGCTETFATRHVFCVAPVEPIQFLRAEGVKSGAGVQ